MNSSEKALEVNCVRKIIENERQKHVIVKDVSFSLERGTITAIVGKSGCGKSTLLSIVSGIDAPASGSVKLFGKDFTALRLLNRNASEMKMWDYCFKIII